MIKKITQKEFTNEIINWTGENVSFCSFTISQTNIKTLEDVEILFNKYNISESIKSCKNVKENLKVETKSNYLLLNNSRLDMKGNCFKYNDDIIGIMDDFLIIYYRNK